MEGLAVLFSIMDIWAGETSLFKASCLPDIFKDVLIVLIRSPIFNQITISMNY